MNPTINENPDAFTKATDDFVESLRKGMEEWKVAENRILDET